MQKFFLDLNEILTGRAGADPTEGSFLATVAIFAVVGLAAFILAILVVYKTAPKRVKKVKVREAPKSVEIIEEEPIEEPAGPSVNVGEFGKIASKTTVSIKGMELNYFIIKKSKYESDTLPIGSIVVVLKRSAKEAYVKLADDKDLKRFKGGRH